MTTAARPPQVEIALGESAHGSLSRAMANIARQVGPVFSVPTRTGPWRGRRVIYLVGGEGDRTFFANRGVFSREIGWRPVLGKRLGLGLINMDDCLLHRHLRSALLPVFCRRSIANARPRIAALVEARISGWAKDVVLDVVEAMKEITFDVAGALILGLEPGPEVDALRRAVEDSIRPRILASAQHEDRTSGSDLSPLHQLLLELIEEVDIHPSRRSTALECLEWYRGQHQALPLTRDDVLGQLSVLLVAAYETTTSLAARTLHALAAHPGGTPLIDDATVRVDGTRTADGLGIARLNEFIWEVGRLHPPVMFLPRVSLADVDIAGYTVPAGSPVLLATAAAHRMEQRFKDPDQFRPERFAHCHSNGIREQVATFGGGARPCIGRSLALTEIEEIVRSVHHLHRLTAASERVKQVESIVSWLPEGIPMTVR